MNSCDTWHAAGTRGGRLVTLHSVELTWSQWTSVLTHNIITRGLQVAASTVMAPSLLVLVPGGAHCQQDGGQSGGSEDTLPDIRGVPRFPVCSDRQGLQSRYTAGQSFKLFKC